MKQPSLVEVMPMAILGCAYIAHYGIEIGMTTLVNHSTIEIGALVLLPQHLGVTLSQFELNKLSELNHTTYILRPMPRLLQPVTLAQKSRHQSSDLTDSTSRQQCYNLHACFMIAN
jgi:hypothetical protein